MELVWAQSQAVWAVFTFQRHNKIYKFKGQRKKIQCTYNQMKEQLERMSEWQLSLKVAEKISRINERYQPTHGFRKPES